MGAEECSRVVGTMHGLLIQMTGDTGNSFFPVIATGLSFRILHTAWRMAEKTFLLLVLVGLEFEFRTDKGSGMSSLLPLCKLLDMTGATLFSCGSMTILIPHLSQMAKAT